MKKNNLNFLKHKSEIDNYLVALIKQKRKEYQQHDHADESFSYLEKFVKSGKSVRGSLFIESILEFLPNEDYKKYLPVAAGIELVHSALLIQDDYMDQDESRRGMPSFYSSAEDYAKKRNYRYSKTYSPSALICLTDIVFFLAFEQFSISSSNKNHKLFKYISSEYVHVGFSQWSDVAIAHTTNEDHNLEEINIIYNYKTARYTFVSPVRLAGIIADIPADVLDQVDKVMNDIGMVFQIRDDYLNLFGDQKITGKPVGGDIIENKKTLYRYHLYQKLSEQNHPQLEKAMSLYGKKKIKSSEIKFLKDLHSQLGVTQILEAKVKEYKDEIFASLPDIKISKSFKQKIAEIFTFVANREK